MNYLNRLKNYQPIYLYRKYIMPIYDYICKECQTLKKDILVSSFDALSPRCERCGKLMKKLIGTPSFVFKGNGFHATDYKEKK